MNRRDMQPQWEQETALERLRNCRTMLHIHGFLTDGESAKVALRIDEWAANNDPADAIRAAGGG